MRLNSMKKTVFLLAFGLITAQIIATDSEVATTADIDSEIASTEAVKNSAHALGQALAWFEDVKWNSLGVDHQTGDTLLHLLALDEKMYEDSNLRITQLKRVLDAGDRTTLLQQLAQPNNDGLTPMDLAIELAPQEFAQWHARLLGHQMTPYLANNKLFLKALDARLYSNAFTLLRDGRWDIDPGTFDAICLQLTKDDAKEMWDLCKFALDNVDDISILRIALGNLPFFSQDYTVSEKERELRRDLQRKIARIQRQKQCASYLHRAIDFVLCRKNKAQ